MASSHYYLADTDNVWRGLENIGDLKICIELYVHTIAALLQTFSADHSYHFSITSLPTDIEQYSKKFKLTEDVVGAVSAPNCALGDIWLFSSI